MKHQPASATMLFLFGTLVSLIIVGAAAMRAGSDVASASMEVGHPIQNAGPLPEPALGQLGIKACVPFPAIESPPLQFSDSRANAVIDSRERPCPDGLVPQPIERRAFKGRAIRQRPVVRTAAAANPATAVPSSGLEFYYSGAFQFTTAAGASVFMTQHLPWLMLNDHHSLAEMAVESTDRRQIIEVGWTVDRALHGDEDTHLFVYHWIDGVETCYNGCGWVQVSPTRFPGMRLTYDGSAHLYMIEYRAGNWWVGYEGEWMGFFPGFLWNGTFTEAGLLQWFGELASSQSGSVPLSSIGNYYQGTSGSPDAAQMSEIMLYSGTGGPPLPATLSFHNSDNAMYDTVAGSSPNSFTYGGHGDAP